MDAILQNCDDARAGEADTVDSGVKFKGNDDFLFGIIPYYDLRIHRQPMF